MTIEFTLVEIENLIMMHEHCKRHFNHEYALTAVKKLNGARKEYLRMFTEPPVVDELEQRDGKLF